MRNIRFIVSVGFVAGAKHENEFEVDNSTSDDELWQMAQDEVGTAGVNAWWERVDDTTVRFYVTAGFTQGRYVNELEVPAGTSDRELDEMAADEVSNAGVDAYWEEA